MWDVIGQWWPIDREGVSAVVDADKKLKWFGLQWDDVDENMIIKFKPSKTCEKTGGSMSYSLTKAPMVMEELQHWSAEQRIGPMIVSETSGLPYLSRNFTHAFNRDRKAAGLGADVWARDLRASGITEGRASNASTDDAAKVAGHSNKQTTGKVYDRAVLEATDRFADARILGRKQSGNTSGNVR